MEQKLARSGIVLINKPVGLSSNAVVNIVRRQLGAKKAGHLGTLDLEGAGLLPITLNNATKLFDFFLHKNKTYESEFVFGFETDTLDMAGKVTKEKFCDISFTEVENVCKKMIGKQSQMPPMYSAKKVRGKVAYKEALKGNMLELRPKEIEIFDLKLLAQTERNSFKFEISCSSGTYIRSVCRDMAEKLGAYGTMKNILRTKCGNFDIKDAFTIEQVKNGEFEIIPCEKLFEFEKISLNKIFSEKLLNGMTLLTENLGSKFLAKSDGIYEIFCEQEFLGLGEIKNGKLKLTLRLL